MTEAEYQHPTTIWLQPWCDKCQRSADDRTWCRDDVYVRCECGAMPVKYVLASDQPQPRLIESDLAESLTKRAEQAWREIQPRE